jgi:hypothetical protein
VDVLLFVVGGGQIRKTVWREVHQYGNGVVFPPISVVAILS